MRHFLLTEREREKRKKQRMRKEGRDAALLCTPSVPWLVYHRVQYPPRTCQGEPWSAPPSALSA